MSKEPKLLTPGGGGSEALAPLILAAARRLARSWSAIPGLYGYRVERSWPPLLQDVTLTELYRLQGWEHAIPGITPGERLLLDHLGLAAVTATVTVPAPSENEPRLKPETKHEPRLEPEVEIVARAAEVIGSRDLDRWMDTEVPSLGGRKPRHLLGTPEGRAEVEQVLTKIDHGVF